VVVAILLAGDEAEESLAKQLRQLIFRLGRPAVVVEPHAELGVKGQVKTRFLLQFSASCSNDALRFSDSWR